MKKILFALLITATTFINAEFTGPDKTPKRDYGSVLEVQRQPIKNVRVNLKGHIIEMIDHHKYMFQDSSGKIILIIKDKVLADVTVSPTTLVEIHGRIHRGRSRIDVTIDVQSIQVIKQ